MQGMNKELVVLTIAGLDWPSFLERSRDGGVPALAALARRGAFGPVRPSGSDAPLADWATLATGRWPEHHRLFRSEETWSGGLRPTGRASWGAAPVWDWLGSAGVATAVSAFPATTPGAAWRGLHLDDRIAEPTGRTRDDWALLPRCAPAALRDAIRDIRVHPTDISGQMLLPLIPALATVDQSRDHRVAQTALAMAAAATDQALANLLLDVGGWRAGFFHQNWLGRMRDLFDRADAPFDLAVDGAWRFLDAVTGHLIAHAGPDCTIVIVSPGYGGAAGVLIAAGPNIAAGTSIGTVDPVDVAPTLLARFGLRAADLPGTPIGSLSGAPQRDAPPPPAIVPPAPDPDLTSALAAAGYPPLTPPPSRWRRDGLVRLAKIVFARSPAAAGHLTDQALAIDPADPTALSIRAAAHVALQEIDALPALADALTTIAPQRSWGPLVRGAYHALREDRGAATPWLRAAEDAATADGEVETLVRVGAAWLVLKAARDASRILTKAVALDPAHAGARLGLSVAALGCRDIVGAEVAARHVLARNPVDVAAWLQLAQVLRTAGRSAEAERAESAAARIGLPA